jgi:hypothetical protein
VSGESVRELLGNHLEPLLPEGWQLLRFQANITTISEKVVILKHNKITKLAEAPQGTLSNEFIVTIVSPLSDMEKAESDLDDAVLELLTALDSSAAVNWTEAQKVKVSEKTPYIGWDITLTVHTQKES